MARGMVRRGLVRSPRRSMFWEGAQFASTLPTGTVDLDVMVAESILENIPNPTIIRCRGNVLIYATAIGASGAQCLLSLGILRVTARALAAGVSSVPTPGTNAGSDWLWHDIIPIGVRGSLGADSEAEGAHVTRLVIDNKAMRKIEPNEALIMVYENTAITSTVTCQVTGGARFLFKK